MNQLTLLAIRPDNKLYYCHSENKVMSIHNDHGKKYYFHTNFHTIWRNIKEMKHTCNPVITEDEFEKIRAKSILVHNVNI
jgi:hypothetical protein